MFTIKHVDSSFNEFAIEAESFEARLDPDCFRFMAYDQKYRDGAYTGLWAGEAHDYKTPDTDTIYVMNSKGATVAVYHFMAGSSA